MTKHMTLGDEIPLKQKRGRTVKPENSRYYRKTEKNPWREVEISEANLIHALSFVTGPTSILKRGERIERVIVGEPVSGVYPLAVSIIKRKEVED